MDDLGNGTAGTGNGAGRGNAGDAHAATHAGNGANTTSAAHAARIDSTTRASTCDGRKPSRRATLITRRNVLLTAGVSLAAGAAAGAATAFALPGGEAGGAPSETGMGAQGQAPGGQGGADTMTFDYTGSYTGAIEASGEDVTESNGSYAATEADQVAALAQDGGTLALTAAQLTKTGDDTDGDRCNFYGVNSIATAVGEQSAIYLDGCALEATSEGSNGVFATNKATILVNDSSITTSAGNARGLDATYGGTVVAHKMTISTQGDHCAGVATDRGGGSISVTDSTIKTGGSGSPILYSTGDVQVSGITGTATGSQLAGMEGLNTILIKDCSLTSTVTGKTASDPVANGVIIYQSTSGDAESTTGETATFQVSDSTLTSAIESGALLFLTNTAASIVLSNTALDFDTGAARLLYAAGNDANSWGQAGSNGATVTFTGRGQTLAGDISADTISQVSVYLLDASAWTGAAVIEENSNGQAVDAPLTVNVDAASAWVVTESCTVSALNVEDGGQVVDESGAAVTIVAGGATVQSGSSVTVTVTGDYGTTVSAGDETELKGSDDMIDRSAFDERFGTSTGWTM